MPESAFGADGGDGQPDRIPDEVVVDLVSDDGCREVLACLADAAEPVPVDDLARTILARERGVDPESIERGDVRAVRDEIFQHRLPRLTPTGLVSYDSMLGTAELDTSDRRVLSTIER